VPSPASQPDYVFEKTEPSKVGTPCFFPLQLTSSDQTHDIATIAYYPRAARQYIEPQTMILRLNGKGEANLELVKTVGTPDIQFGPVTTAADSDKLLKVNVFDEVKKAFEDRWWMTASAPTPRLGEKQYQWTEVEPTEWDRKD
jgi:hypothetical protein